MCIVFSGRDNFLSSVHNSIVTGDAQNRAVRSIRERDSVFPYKFHICLFQLFRVYLQS